MDSLWSTRDAKCVGVGWGCRAAVGVGGGGGGGGGRGGCLKGGYIGEQGLNTLVSPLPGYASVFLKREIRKKLSNQVAKQLVQI